MKTKLTFLTIAITAFLGVGMLMAFKQGDKHKQYLTLNVYSTRDKIIIVDENGTAEEKVITNFAHPNRFSNGVVELSNEINKISAKGYKLSFISPINNDLSAMIQYVFEKE